MKKFPLIVIIAVIVFAIIGFVIYSSQGKSNIQTAKDSSKKENTNSNSEISSSNILDLLKSGKSLECTFSKNEEGTLLNGTIFVSSNKMRGNFETTTEGKKINAFMVRDGESIYTWTDLSKQGVKIKVDDEKSLNQDTQEAVNVTENFNFNCKNWNSDNNQFSLPKDIEFTETNLNIKNTSNGSTEVNDIKCSACDSIPDASQKETCKKTLGC